MTITAEQRDAIYREVVDDLGAVGDIFLLLCRGDWKAALRHRRRFEEDMRLLDDLGWEPEQPGDEFVLTMPPDELARMLRRLTDSAAATLHQFVVLPLEEQRNGRASQSYPAGRVRSPDHDRLRPSIPPARGHCLSLEA